MVQKAVYPWVLRSTLCAWSRKQSTLVCWGCYLVFQPARFGPSLVNNACGKNTKFWFWYYVCIFSMMYLCGFVTTLNKRELFSLNHPKLENVNTSRTISNPFYNTLLAHPYSFPFGNLSIILPTHLFSIIATCH